MGTIYHSRELARAGLQCVLLLGACTPEDPSIEGRRVDRGLATDDLAQVNVDRGTSLADSGSASDTAPLQAGDAGTLCGSQNTRCDASRSTECSADSIDDRACGGCGRQRRCCTEAGRWGPWGECSGRGDCSSGTLSTRNCLGEDFQVRRCGDDCRWGDWSPCDRDLDGLADADDTEPDDPYGQRQWTAAGSAAHREERVPEVLTTTWDGRVTIGVFVTQDEENGRQFEYAARAFQPRTISDGKLTGSNFSARVNFDPHDATLGNLHLGLFRDVEYLPAAAMGQNPYPSNASGRPTEGGVFRTYKVGIIGVMRSEAAEAPHAQRLSLNHGTIVVGNALGERPFIQAASVDGRSQPLTTVSGANLYRYEPTVSLDGRLVLWHGVPQNRFRGTATLYSFNPTPMRSTGWSEPRNVAAMHWVHGPGAARETMVNGVPFSQRYPLAQRPLRDPDGRVLRPDDLISGPYPWLSFDASELFVSTVATFSGAIQSGSVAVGARTNWTIEHLDSSLNVARATLSSDGEIHFSIRSEGARLLASYRQHTLGDGSPIGRRGYARVLVSSLFLSGSMWDPSLGQQYPPLPFTGVNDTYGIITNTFRYAEVALNKVSDGHYLLALPMNEQLRFNHDELRKLQTGNAPRELFWTIQREMVAHDPRRTPDVSGQRQTARLIGAAAFPFEYHDALGRWRRYYQARQADPALPDTAEGVSGDTIDGIVGNAIYFRPGGRVVSTLNSTSHERLRQASALSVQLWVKPLARDGAYALYHQRGIGTLVLDRLRRPHFSTGQAGQAAAVASAPLPLGVWSHLALVIDGDRVRLYVDGEAVAAAATAPDSSARSAEVIVGPHNVDNNAAGEALCLIDEFSLSDIARSLDEIRRAALRRPIARDPSPPTTATGAFVGREQWLPDGVQISDARVQLGQALFFDARLSRDGTISCASCHMQSRAFTDGRVTAVGIAGRQSDRNSQTVLNRLFGRRHFWDGRANSLEEQVLEPIADAREMDFSVAQALERLAADTALVARFAAAYPGQATPSRFQLANALASYLRSLQSGSDSPFDREQLGPAARRGRAIFFGKGRCSGCHNGPNFSDERFHNVGLDISLASNHGRALVTGRRSDLGRFKTPTLRQLAYTAPYFHDGRFASLAEVVAFYNRGGDRAVGRDLAIQPLGLNASEQLSLVAFLRGLSD